MIYIICFIGLVIFGIWGVLYTIFAEELEETN